MKSNQSNDVDHILRPKAVCKVIGVGRTQLYELRKSGDFPPAIKLGKRSVGWRVSVIDGWLTSRPKSKI